MYCATAKDIESIDPIVNILFEQNCQSCNNAKFSLLKKKKYGETQKLKNSMLSIVREDFRLKAFKRRTEHLLKNAIKKASKKKSKLLLDKYSYNRNGKFLFTKEKTFVVKVFRHTK